MSNKIYNACIYARLSRDDGDKLESDSITNQKALIRDFLSKHPEIHVVSEKTDDGYSGVNFDRPAFQEMMDEIRSGKVNCVVVKDLSRFGRIILRLVTTLKEYFLLWACASSQSMIVMIAWIRISRTLLLFLLRI